MATLKKIKRSRGEAYQIGFSHPKSGRWIRKTIYCNLKEAKKIKNKIEADLALDIFKFDEKNSDDTSWQALLIRYVKYAKRNKSEKTNEREKNVFDSFSRFLNGDIPISEISESTIENYKQSRLNSEIRSATVAIELRILKTVFYIALKWKLIEINPVVGIKIPKDDIVKVRFLRINEIVKLIQVTIDDDNLKFAHLILAYINTGARRNELLFPNFTWKNIDMPEKKIQLNGKGQMKRFIPINSTLFEIFKSLQVQKVIAPFEFKPDYVTHKIQKYYKLAGIKGANLHSLRKTFGSLLLQNKAADLYTVSRLLGHTSVKTTEKYYVDLLDDNYRDSVDRLDNILPKI
ncbi:MAG: tyrosine-type recombinase/integrase [Candidatus Marinimicrobia bacterium]|nr:tyrosine-type recombinase/integrase [Candidatus Neomarinimicrobiota bacterium]MBT5529286.1 tyrosine-type recombinase/integrase [Cytophagia bacterium]